MLLSAAGDLAKITGKLYFLKMTYRGIEKDLKCSSQQGEIFRYFYARCQKLHATQSVFLVLLLQVLN